MLSRLLVAWTFDDTTPSTAPLQALIDYTISAIGLLTIILTGWWAGTSAQAALTSWIDRQFAAGRRRWRDTPRSRSNDFLFVNAVAVL
ncbi:hypothetical protein [Dactylosporangium darangshiense]|uniref:Uncharacterized protein n=1 Tax=Dactylosporangium darangshiense TaxID=579108 RepID=A0ABP8DCF5_9ACTN